MSNDVVTSVKAALERDPDINLHRFPIRLSFDNQANELSMEGSVEDIIALRKAVQIARRVSGSDRIRDDLYIRQPTNRTGDQLRESVVRALSGEPTFRDVSVGDAESVAYQAGDDQKGIVVNVSGSCVHLKGNLNSLTHRRLAELLAWWVPGTSRVENRIHVQPPEEDSDTELTEAVRIALEKDASLDAGQIHVQTRDREVTLEGSVRSEINRTIASRDCWYIPGVHAVHNQLRVMH